MKGPADWQMLNLSDLGNLGVPGIAPGLGSALAEAGAVCLDSKGHQPGVLLAVRGISNRNYTLDWTPSTAQVQRAWQYNRATELGAEAIAVLLAQSETPYTIVEASERGSGIDYWLGDEWGITFQRKARLEISGIRRRGETMVSESIIAARVDDKMQQTARSDDSQTPAYVIVVEFGRPVAEVHQK